MSTPENSDSVPRAAQPVDSETTGFSNAENPHVAGAQPPAEGELLAGRFALRSQIGRGGAGTVFSAFDTKVGQQVAVKVLHADIREGSQLERLRREVRASRPGHPNAVAVYDLFDDGGRRFLTMELIEGHSVSQEFAKVGNLPVEETVAIGRQIAAALADLHAKGLIHRDVKPGNILLTSAGTVKLCDMGLARSTMRGGTITETEMVVGTPAYMAPEQALAGDLTAASDVYALGLTLFQCLTGEVPLQEDTAVATLMLRQRSRPPRLRKAHPESPKWLDRLIRRMLNPEPGERPSAAEVEKAFAEERVSFRIRLRRKHLVSALIVLVVAIASVAGFRALKDRPAASVEVFGSDVVGLDHSGSEIWRRHLEQPQVVVLRADLDGDGSDEVLVAGSNEHQKGGLPGEIRQSKVLILTASGKIVTELDPEQKIGSWSFRYRLEVNPALSVLDLDGDGWPEVVATCRQRHFFPTVLMVYWPRWNTWDKVLRHPGTIYEVYQVPDGSPPGLRFVAVNNRLAMYSILGELALVPPGQRDKKLTGKYLGIEAPPYGPLSGGSLTWLRDYVPLRMQDTLSISDKAVIEASDDGGWIVGLFGRAVRLDTYLNPADGPNVGRDLREMRVEFYRLLHSIKPGFHSYTSEGISEVRETMYRMCGPLLAEPAYESIFLDTLGQALARADDLDRAVEILGPAFLRLQNDDLGFRLANLEAIRGDLDAASSWLQLLMDQGSTQRSRYDAPQLMLRVAIEQHNSDQFASSLSYINGRFRSDSPRINLGTTLWAGARLWWDETSEADTRVRSVDFAEDGDAVGCLVRWRRGISRADDPPAMRMTIESNPDAAGIGWAALSAALLGVGRTAEALEASDNAVAMLDEWSKDNFRELQNLQLVRAVRVVALLQSGDRELARREAHRLKADLNPNLLPGILIAEVIEETEDLKVDAQGLSKTRRD